MDRIADELDRTSAQVATAWVRQRAPRMIPIMGVRKLSQLRDLLGGADLALSPDHMTRLEEVSRVELTHPYDLLCSPKGQMVYGDLEPRLDLPPTAARRWYRSAAG